MVSTIPHAVRHTRPYRDPMTRSLLRGTFAVGLVVALVGCTPGAPNASDPTPSMEASSPTPSATPTPTPSVAPEPEPAPAATCENLLDPDFFALILADGFTLDAPGYIEKIRGEGAPEALFDEFGGLLCVVNNGTRVSELYGYSPISPDNQAAQEARLAGDGWVSSSVDGGTLWIDPVEREGVVFVYFFRNGFWWCGYDTDVITMIVSNSPAS